MNGEAFYVPDGDRYTATDYTRGPWTAESQHVGPPAALLGREMQRCDRRPGWQMVRVTVEILRPVPITVVAVDAAVERPGKSVELVTGRLWDDDGDLLHARAWRLRTEDVALPEIASPSGRRPPGPESGTVEPFFDVEAEVGYHTAMDARFIDGSFRQPGPAVVWLRMAKPLVAGEDPDALARVLVVADTGNGASAALDPATHLFINTDVSVHLHRLPVGQWICLDARSYLESHGVGVAEGELFDEQGRLGRALQSLFVAER